MQRPPKELEMFYRHDVKGFDRALEEACAKDPALLSDQGRLAMVAAELYESCLEQQRADDEQQFRPAYLQQAVIDMDFLPMIQSSAPNHEVEGWYSLGLINTERLSERERKALADIVSKNDCYEEKDGSYMNFVAYSARSTEPPSKKARLASERLAKDKLLSLVNQRLEGGGHAIKSHARPLWERGRDALL